MLTFSEKHPFIMRSVWRRIYRRANPVFFPTIHVNEYPKSGGTWLCRMISEALDFRFDDNRFSKFGSAVMKHHDMRLEIPKQIVVVRDPRDVALSFYYHRRNTFDEDPFNKKSVDAFNKHIFKKGLSKNEELIRFVEVLTRNPQSPSFTWHDFYQNALSGSKFIVSYEDLRLNTAETLISVITNMNIDIDRSKVEAVAEAHQIDKLLAKRKDNSKHHFIRKGKLNNWKEELPSEAVIMVEANAGDLLTKFGYA